MAQFGTFIVEIGSYGCFEIVEIIVISNSQVISKIHVSRLRSFRNSFNKPIIV